eukprot:scaffold3890_cov33-Attheya_sp.AAC.4
MEQQCQLFYIITIEDSKLATEAKHSVMSARIATRHSVSVVLLAQKRVALNRDSWDVVRHHDDPIRQATLFHDFLNRTLYKLPTYYYNDKAIKVDFIANDDLNKQAEEEMKEYEQKWEETKRRKYEA